MNIIRRLSWKPAICFAQAYPSSSVNHSLISNGIENFSLWTELIELLIIVFSNSKWSLVSLVKLDALYRDLWSWNSVTPEKVQQSGTGQWGATMLWTRERNEDMCPLWLPRYVYKTPLQPNTDFVHNSLIHSFWETYSEAFPVQPRR